MFHYLEKNIILASSKSHTYTVNQIQFQMLLAFQIIWKTQSCTDEDCLPFCLHLPSREEHPGELWSEEVRAIPADNWEQHGWGWKWGECEWWRVEGWGVFRCLFSHQKKEDLQSELGADRQETPQGKREDTCVTQQTDHVSAFSGLMWPQSSFLLQTFLASLNPPLVIPDEKILRWHPSFTLDTIPDVEEAELPKPPITGTIVDRCTLQNQCSWKPYSLVLDWCWGMFHCANQYNCVLFQCWFWH